MTKLYSKPVNHAVSFLFNRDMMCGWLSIGYAMNTPLNGSE